MEDLKKAAILLICSECNFHLGIHDYSFKFKKEVKLEFGRVDYKDGPFTKSQTFYVEFDGRELFNTPEEAIDRYFELWQEHEIGNYWIDAGYSGH